MKGFTKEGYSIELMRYLADEGHVLFAEDKIREAEEEANKRKNRDMAAETIKRYRNKKNSDDDGDVSESRQERPYNDDMER